MARVLTMVERWVSSNERDAYLATVAQRARAAAADHAHFWVFEHTDESGHFVEFTEGADANSIAAVHHGEMPGPLWRAIEGG